MWPAFELKSAIVVWREVVFSCSGICLPPPGMADGTAFVHITDPVNPEVIGMLPTHTVSSSWRDIKVYKDHAFIVSEASGHGMQVSR